MSRPLFLPSLRQILWLAAVTAVSVGYALYLRHQVIEQATVGIACETGAQTFICSTRKTALMLFTPSVFGFVALGAATLNLLRPSVVLCTIALIAGGLGIVLYNVVLSSLAAALLILSLARPAPEPE